MPRRRFAQLVKDRISADEIKMGPRPLLVSSWALVKILNGRNYSSTRFNCVWGTETWHPSFDLRPLIINNLCEAQA